MRVALCGLALLLAACEREPSFDERYDAAREHIGEKADELDTDLERPRPGETGEDGSSESDKKPGQ